MGRYWRKAGVYCSLVFVGLLGWRVVGVEVDLDHYNDAATATGTFTVRCNVPEITAFVPKLSYITQHITTSPVPQCTASLSHWSPINGESEPSIDCKQQGTSTLILDHTTPAMKLSGLQCRAASASDLAVQQTPSHSDSSVALGAPHHAAPLTPLHVGALTMLYGNGGSIHSSVVRDGSDWDGHWNGEIAFGGTRLQTGGSHTRVTISGSRTSSEPLFMPALSFVFTPHD